MNDRPWYDLDMGGYLDEMLLFYLGSSWQGMADIGECLDTGNRIKAKKNMYSAWSREWRKTAKRIFQNATSSETGGHYISAGEAYLRAANYYFAALHVYPRQPDEPNKVKCLTRRGISCFRKALKYLSLPGVPVDIPYENNTHLSGYFFRSPCARQEKAPILIVHPGRDSWAEQYKFLADGAVKRGYHCLLFDGPGQGRTIRLQNLPLRPDWEKAVTPVVDFAISQEGVDPDRIALMGCSMGGALATRAAAFEKRLKICIVNPGVYSWRDYIYGQIAYYLDITSAKLDELVEKDPETLKKKIQALMSDSAMMELEWGMKDEMWKYGATSPDDYLKKVKAFTNEGIAEQISCRMLVMNGTGDDKRQQAEQLYEALNTEKDYMLFTEEDTALLHVQVAASSVASRRLFDWLDEYL